MKDSFLATGLTTRVHGNKNNKPKHALTFDEIKYLVTFITNYAERHAILLPGRIPGYKRDDVQLLPSSTTKKVYLVQHTYRMHPHIVIHILVTYTCTQHAMNTSSR